MMSRLRVAKIGCQPWIRIGVAKDVRMHAEPGGGADVAAKTSPPPFFPLHFQAEDDVCFAALCCIVSRPRPCGDGALWEIWAVGASHAGGSSSSGHSAAAVPAGDDGRGISVFCLFQPGSGGNQRDHPELSLGLLESPFSMFHNMGLCSRPRGGPGPNAWKHFGPELDPGVRALHKAPGRRGILEGGLRGGGPGRPPFWRTLISPTERWGRTPVSLKINTRHTHSESDHSRAGA